MKRYVENSKGITVEVWAEEGYEVEVSQLMGIIIGQRGRLRDGYIIEIGWAVFKIDDLGEGVYGVSNPDYAKNPEEDYIKDLTVSLRIIYEHKQVIKLFGVEGEDVRYDEKVVITESAKTSKHVFMQREEAGWYVGSVNTPEDESEELINAYELLRIKPELVKTLVLPQEYIAAYKEGYLVSVLNEEDKDIMEDIDLTIEYE